jgi:hypothetical protein
MMDSQQVKLIQPLSSPQEGPSLLQDPPSTTYSRPGVLSQTTFLWLNPLIRLGSPKSLHKEDVLELAPQYQAMQLQFIFASHWPKEINDQGPPTHATLHTLWSCFWWPIAYTGLLLMVKVGVTFVGPLLIQSFVDFCS